MTRSIYLISASAENFGDDIIALSWIRKIKKNNLALTIFIDTPNPSSLSYLHHSLGETGNIIFVDLFWKITYRYQQEWWDALNSLYTDLSQEKISEIRLLNEIFINIECLHFLGGGYINSLWIKNLFLLKIASYLRSKFKFKLIWTGASIIPTPKVPLFDIAESISFFDLITTRDKESESELIKWNQQTKFTCDDLFLTLGEVSNDENAPDFLIINNQRDLRSIEFFIDSIERLRNIIKFETRPICYIQALESSDQLTFDYLKQINPKIKMITRTMLIQEFMSGKIAIGKNSHAIVSRFHLHLLFSSIGIRGQYISPPDEYYKKKHDSIKSINSGYLLFSENIEIGTAFPPPTIHSLHTLKNQEFSKIYEIT